ncbi:helix-turn-helix domain-containing protein [Caminibacter mediatlanticus TB-2]|uniref:Helix-turn-helix domain-containing protein n=1 Tax=Caminibacter mediatlanticus TB-2 TaxID=391592 RepID=A0ABX5V682_9BACT|nr:helix-turn-helix domain-containing protein [Caminibacter mediatlanticus]QCT93783.1 helix-turn-helix domain-containing protein [Caminibacter mediatlanticus TB-2]
MKLVTQAELAKHLKVSKPYINKLVKKGVFDNCFDGEITL